MSYRNALNYLESKTKVIEHYNRFGARVAVCPEWNGRVMTSTCDGLDGTCYGLIHVAAIDSNRIDRFFGGEDQLTLAPESGPFSLHDEPSSNTVAARRFSPAPVGFREGPFTVDTVPPAPQIRMRRTVQMTNSAGTALEFDIVRAVRLLDNEDIDTVFGSAVAVALEQADISFVGFETLNTLHNRGAPLARESGLVSIGIRSMFNSGQNAVAIVPFQPGEDDELGPTFCADYLGAAPHGRLRTLPQAALLRADGRYRCRIGVSRKRALPFLGSIDFRVGLITLTTFNLPSEPWKHDYSSNAFCEITRPTGTDFVSTRKYFQRKDAVREADDIGEESDIIPAWDPNDTAYSGEVVRAYNHGSAAPGEVQTANFYEFGVFSPAKALDRGEALTHHQYTAHINADNQTLAHIAQTLLGVDYDRVYEKLIR